MSDQIEIQQFPLWDKLKDKRVPLSFDLSMMSWIYTCAGMHLRGGLCLRLPLANKLQG